MAAVPSVADGEVQVKVTAEPALAVGAVLFTVTVTTSVATQPDALVTVNVYVVVTVAEQVGVALEAELNPVAGFHE